MVLQDEVCFQGVQRGEENPICYNYKCSRLNQKSGSDNSGDLAYTVFVTGGTYLIIPKVFDDSLFLSECSNLKRSILPL